MLEINSTSICTLGGCDNLVKLWNLQTNQSQPVAQHDKPIRHVKVMKDMQNMLITGSWDGTVRYWDLRQQKCVFSKAVGEKIFAMDAVYPVLAVGLAGNRQIQVTLP